MKRYLRVILPILTFLVIAFILSNSFSDGAQATAKRDFVVKAVAGEKNFARLSMKVIAKLFHMMEYAAFSFFLTESVLVLGDMKSGRFERILLCGVMLAITDEMIQSLFSGRGSRLTDVLVDGAGVMVGYAVALFLAYLVKKRIEKRKKGT